MQKGYDDSPIREEYEKSTDMGETVGVASESWGRPKVNVIPHYNDRNEYFPEGFMNPERMSSTDRAKMHCGKLLRLIVGGSPHGGAWFEDSECIHTMIHHGEHGTYHLKVKEGRWRVLLTYEGIVVTIASGFEK